MFLSNMSVSELEKENEKCDREAENAKRKGDLSEANRMHERATGARVMIARINAMNADSLSEWW